MCLAIPGQVIEIVDDLNRLAKVDVAGVRRNVNVGLLDGDDGGVGPGDWVLIHVGFAISKVDEEDGLKINRRLWLARAAAGASAGSVLPVQLAGQSPVAPQLPARRDFPMAETKAFLNNAAWHPARSTASAPSTW